jgi:hypothetical protein
MNWMDCILRPSGEVMKTAATFRSLFLLAASCIAALALSAPAFAQHGAGGHGGGYHGGGGGYHGGYGGYHGGYGWHGYGWHGGYGWRGYGWYGGYGYGWPGAYYAPWGWPLYYPTAWWGGVPYYYADNPYYRWNGAVNQYETVSPPQGPQSSELIVYPKNGQSQEQMGTDKFECHRWAAAQTGFDPTRPAGGSASGRRADYFRAQRACLDGRGYTVR